MNFPQTKSKNKLVILFIFILFFGLYFNNVKAFGPTNITQITKNISCKDVPEGHRGQAEEAVKEQIGSGAEIKVIDLLVAGKLEKINCTDTRSFIKRVMDQVTTWAIQEKRWLLEEGVAIAYKAALKNFLNTLAADTATYLATGDKGQRPMFITDSWGDYLKNTADNAAGTFIEELGKSGPVKFNLCAPNADVMLKINLGLDGGFRPKPPSCSFSQLRDNWEAALNDKDFLPKFQDMFNPWSNDLGIALTLQSSLESEISRKVNEAAQKRIADKGWLSVRSLISDKILTPAEIVSESGKVAYGNSFKNYMIYTGSATADAIDVFLNTLIGKLIDKWLKKGIVTDFADNTRRWNSLADPEAQNTTEGITGAESRFRSLVETNFKVRAAYDILAELTMCPDPNKAGPTNCVIDQRFREAIEKRLTVEQALKQGYLNGNGVFGFMADGLEPKYNEGYPYRSMLILRKFRIIPVGWEIAAQKIKDQQGLHCSVNGNSCDTNADCPNPQICTGVGGTKNLSDLVNCAKGDWCEGLVDSNWVLKAPQNFCAKEGAGPEILSEEVTGEGAASSLSILRNDTYCADEKSLIKENSDGSNPLYGYCTEERRIWDFNAKSCAPRDNTCQTFSSTDLTRAGGETVSYLQNTLDFSVCNAGNAGCAKYATSGSLDAESKSVVWDGADNPVYLNKNVQTCEAADEGCHGFIRITPDKNETYDDIKTAGIDEAYKRFSLNGLIHEKLLPDYLVNKKADGSRQDYDEGACYDNQGRLKISAPAQCSNFVRQCEEEEAGCELYTNATNGSKIPAKVKPNDYCPAECVGYDTFVQKETIFDSGRPAFLIPKTAKICSAESAGCDEFTNLEKIATSTPNVAEQKEYYSYLRQCIKPDTEGKTCGEFYNWEGSDETGYQLKVASLQADGAGPAVTEADAALCNAEIYNYPLSNPAHNPDCREFYNRAGEIFYHLFKRTISCSEDCHPYRRTELNIDTAITSAAACASPDKRWDGTKQECAVCKSGGVWSDENNACIYLAIPSQGTICPSAQNGCREYNGNTGNDVRNIFTDDFSGGLTGSWTGFNGSQAIPSSEALTLDADNKGNSLSVTGSPFSVSRTVGAAVSRRKSYVLSFLAKAAGKTDFNISLAAGVSGAKADFAQVKNVGADWQIYKTSLTDLNHEITADEILLIEAGQNFYIDSVALTEITDRYYLIKDSWRTPLACDSELDGVYHEHYMLGCDQYANRAGEASYLKSFSELCSESAVGCELMIDTKNSSATTMEIFSRDGTDKIVPADEFTYAVYDQNKLCNQEAKGCALLGKAYKYEDAILYGDVYLKNNPDSYKTILCGADAVSCQIFTYNDGDKDGEKYFKDPGLQACEWRRQIGAGDREDWFKKKVKRCGSDSGAVCLSDGDCLPGVKCQLETADKFCPTDENKTLGLGGIGGQVSQPGEDSYGKWAGVCAAANSGCGEYIDPVSRFNTNIISNGSFADLDNDGGKADGWINLKQDVTLEPNTVYRLARAADSVDSPVSSAGRLTLSGCSGALYEIDSGNNLVSAAEVTVSQTKRANSKIFYYRGDGEASCIITAGSSAGAVELKPVVIDYQLAQNLDKKSCNGVVDFDKGCVLFNERNYNSASLQALKFDADIKDFSAPEKDEDKDSNAILKVTPDRVCGKWLACRSYVKDEKGNNTCYDLGLCDAVDDKDDCLSFIASPKANQTIESLGADKISNLSGYAKAGLQNGSLGGDYYPLGAMEQKGEVANLANGGFEFYGANSYPLGWTWSGPAAANKPWNENIFSVINNPITAQTEGIGYAPEGRSFLRLGSSYNATSEETDVLPNADYTITAYINTKNLKSGQAKIDIDILDSRGAVIRSEAVIIQNLGNDWQFQVGKFKTGQSSSKIKIRLYSSGSAGAPAGTEGNFYFDDIKIRPVLESKCLEKNGDCSKLSSPYNAWHTVQSCRLYPKTDSLACDYFEDSGKRQKGLPGYCLEYDRPPGNPNTCILWYPVDRVKGDGVEEGDSYFGKFPVYYCLSASASSCSVSGEALIRCDKIVRTVNSIGQNKYWSSRVYQGSDWYTANENGSFIDYDNSGLNKILVDANNKQYNYSYDQAPFGSIAPPFSATDNPFDWDSRADKGIQPLYLEAPPKGQSGLARAGAPYYCDANQYCYLIEFHDGRTFPINSLDVKLFMSAVCGNGCLLNFNGADFTNGSTVAKTLKIGKNNVHLYSDAEGGSGGKGECTNLMEATIILPDGKKVVITRAGNETKTGATPIINCTGNTVDGGITDYAGGDFVTSFNVAYNDHKQCQVNISGGEAKGIASIKNLFAQSYGAWKWNSNGLCAGGVKNGLSCADNNACQGGSCAGRCFNSETQKATDKSCDLNSKVSTSCTALDNGKCVRKDREFICGGKCIGGSRHDEACTENSLCPGGRCAGNKKLIECNAANVNDLCKGCAGQTYGTCTNAAKKCDAGVKINRSCTDNIDKCVGGSKAGRACNLPADCPGGTCEGGCPMYSPGTCDGNKKCVGSGDYAGRTCVTSADCISAITANCKNTCVNGARNGQTCDDNRQCNCSTSDISTCNDNYCPDYDIGRCLNKDVCDAGCNIGQVCNNNDKLCKADQCHQCLGGVCEDASTCVGNKCVGGIKAGQNCNIAADCQIACSNNDNCSGICGGIGYKEIEKTDADYKLLTWGPPGANGEPDNGLCNVAGVGPRTVSAYCAILPQISNIKAQGKDTGLVELKTSQFINLTFNSKVDSQQLPLVMYAIDWGDNEKTVITGVEMRDRPAESGNPHSLFHLYNYWDLKTKANSGVTGIDCLTPGECKIKPKIQIKDNWGWCNHGQTINVCDDGRDGRNKQWDSFSGTIVVREK